MPDLPSGIVTFLFTDIVGSTQLWERHPDVMRGALRRHDALMHTAIAQHGGQVFKTVGDAFHAVFREPQAALLAATDAQRALAQEPWPPQCPIAVRMALHTGVSEPRDEDYFGPTLNQVSRLLSSCHGGQTVVSSVTHDVASDMLSPEITLRDVGEHRFRDLVRPIRVYQILATGLRDEFPPLLSVDLHPTNLPTSTSLFVGRAADMAGIRARLRDHPLLTLVGTGGAGKTRLALQIGEAELGHFPDGVWWVSLELVTDGALVPTAIATALGPAEEPGRSQLETLLDYLKSRQALLLLDRCEHLSDDVAEIVRILLQSCPEVRVLATSREPLRVSGETVWDVPPLAPPNLSPALGTPLTLEAIKANEAVTLFMERAQAVQPSFAITESNAMAIAEVCSRLDGIPLALELAAARMRLLSVEQLRDRLDDRFRLLGGPGSGRGGEHGTLRATIDWSYEHLSPQEQTLFGRLSVFRGGWTLEAAEQVCAGGGVEDWEVLDVLSGVVDQSLVVVQIESQPPYRMLETLRAYAGEQLEASGGRDATARQHAHWYADLAAEIEPELVGRHQQARLNQLDGEQENLAAAMRWTATHDPALGRRIGGGLWRMWLLRGRYDEGCRLLEALVASGEDLGDILGLAKTLHGLGTLRVCQGNLEQGREALEHALEHWREIDDPVRLAHTLNNLAQVAYEQGDYTTARQLFEESLERKLGAGDVRGAANTLGNLGTISFELGDLPAARHLYEEALSSSRQLDDPDLIAFQLLNLGQTAVSQGQCALAQEYLGQSLALREALGDAAAVAESRRFLGVAAHEAGRFDDARRLYAQAVQSERLLGSRFGLAEALKDLGSLELDLQQTADARVVFEESLALQTAIGHRRGECRCRLGLARVALIGDDLAAAGSYLRLCLDMLREMPALDLTLDALVVVADLAVRCGQAQDGLRLLATVEHQRAVSGWATSELRQQEARRIRRAALVSVPSQMAAAVEQEGGSLAPGQAVAAAQTVAQALAGDYGSGMSTT